MRKHFDFWSVVVIVLTLLLFIVALFERGVPHDLLLESGVFLVSVKLIMMSHKNSVIALRVDEHLEEIRTMLRNMHDQRAA
jgi:hypothetical protein